MPTPEEHLAGSPLGLAVLERVRAALDDHPDVSLRVTTSQISFRRRRAFAWLWRPGRYLTRPGAEVVLTVALGRADPSSRWKQVVHPSPRQWVHHLEVHAADEVDDEVAAWLAEAADRA